MMVIGCLAYVVQDYHRQEKLHSITTTTFLFAAGSLVIVLPNASDSRAIVVLVVTLGIVSIIRDWIRQKKGQVPLGKWYW